ncbi:MAG: helix-turn-helix domain-containing protein [Nocardioidaceae bacterium]
MATLRGKPLGESAPRAAAKVGEKARAGKARLDASAAANFETLGGFLKEQRRGAQLSLRQLAEATGVSNPYLSQIERGLRKPSAEVLQQLAKALRISAETLYVRAGILDPDEGGEREVHLAVLADTELNERQKRVLLDIYESFRRESEHSQTPDDHEPLST